MWAWIFTAHCWPISSYLVKLKLCWVGEPCSKQNLDDCFCPKWKTNRQSLTTEQGGATVDTAWGTSPPTRRSPNGSCTLPGCLLGRRSSLGGQAPLTPRTPGSENQHLKLGHCSHENLDQSGDGRAGYGSRHHDGAAELRGDLVEVHRRRGLGKDCSSTSLGGE